METAVCTVTGVIGGMLYVGLRRWLHGPTVLARGVAFGLLMSFGPGLVFLSPVDLNIFEPALPVYLGFVALIVLYGVSVAMLTDRVSPPAAEVDRSRRSRRVVAVATGVVLAFLALNSVVVAIEDAGTCLSGDGNGGCGTPAKK